ncbi:ribosome silencing factor [Caldanaerobacter subterraneus]|uniref:Ribosomal silencing factor RsfS n=1 Tax=Caldanaerobacter subterraneus subsp. pacificus DSM 12653 TaxID=391606 RepID=A0A0F5PNP7_9THEO|nr:ribosome silencing factor [Caldanaerobacter subterraneus]KKC30026.1 hypothetical protein CDSM653_00954 [Caldanaerobacter subterraneus subsp. pacificus DSM 12653]
MIEAKEKVYKICRVLDEKKAFDVKILYIGELTTIADYFILAICTSSTHVQALADEVEKKFREESIFVDHVEKDFMSEWILMDYEDVVVHIFQQEAREFYSLERLWADAKEIVLDNRL